MTEDLKLRLSLFAKMLFIRRVEEAVAKVYPGKEMRCPIHLSIGQEAVPVALGAFLTNDDTVYSTHRCHAHYLAKGGDLNRMIAELFGKVTGCVKGKGGSMHLVDTSVGMMGSSALVGGTIPLAVGSALAFSMSKKPFLSIAYFGDGATEEGIFYESLNFAQLHRLPVIFAVENNLYATYSHQRKRQAELNIAKRAQGLGVTSFQVDGNSLSALLPIAKAATEHARTQGPVLLECLTYRLRDHVGPATDIEVGYRTQEEWNEWNARCPITQEKKFLKEAGALSDPELALIENQIQSQIDTAFAFARQSPFPPHSEIFEDVYAQP